MKDSVEQVYHLLLKMRELHRAFYEAASEFRNQAVNLPQDELVDIAYLCKKMDQLNEDTGKEVRKVGGLSEKLVCYKWVQDVQSNPSTPTRIEGELAHATTKVRAVPTLPRRSDGENYTKLMRHLGMSDSLIESGLFDPKWTAISELVTKLQEDGRPLPPGIVKTNAEFRLLTYAKVEV